MRRLFVVYLRDSINFFGDKLKILSWLCFNDYIIYIGVIYKWSDSHVLPCQVEQQHPKPFSIRLDVLHSSVPILLLNESKALGLLLKNMDLLICISSHFAYLLYLLGWSNFDNIVPKTFLLRRYTKMVERVCLRFDRPEWVRKL